MRGVRRGSPASEKPVRMGWEARAGRWGEMSSSRVIRLRSTSWRRATVVTILVAEASQRGVEGSSSGTWDGRSGLTILE